MERTFPQKVKSVPSCETEVDVLTGQPKQSTSEGNRRVRTSAAVIGLAISVGAHSLLIPGPDDTAVAAEPVASESTASSTVDVAIAPGTETASSTLTPDAAATSVEHTVQDGQTLWQLARFYGVDAATIADENSIPTTVVLRVGQVLKIPTSSRIARSTTRLDVAVSAAPEYYGMVPSAQSPAAQSAMAGSARSTDVVLKDQQDTALSRLQQTRENLRLGLKQLKTVKPSEQLATAEPTSFSQTDKIARTDKIVQTESLPTAVSAGYRVAAGDTLGGIANAHGVTQKQLAEANQLSNPNVIRVNQVLQIPAVSVSDRASVGSSLPLGTSSTLISQSPVAQSASSPRAITSGNPNLVGLPAATVAGSQRSDSAKAVSEPTTIAPLPTLSEKSKGEVELSRPSAIARSVDDASVATAPFVQNGEEAAPKQRYDYVENLRLEIVKLREKYRTASSVPSQPTAMVATASLSSTTSPTTAASNRVNPEFSPSGYTESLRTQVRKLRQNSVERIEAPIAAATKAPEAEKTAKPQLVAAAPLGSQNYEPLLPSSLGQMVSPDLPPLGSVDSYLPNSSGKFAGYIWPTKGVLTSGYGWRWGRMHKGIDIAAPIGTPVVAAASGVVITAGWNSGGYGNLVEVQHPDGSVTLYAHNERILVREGQQVEQGQQISEMGSTGYSTGPHCHFEVHLPGHGSVNPMAHLPRGGA
ncbi:peptidoglycan DD-metalloendopeptidase family protein [Leptolyngbya sp. FACHB-36]|uniref:peptidoglycan DD-metalloendopeptidase family protein n=1 Tax=Leptolyngbya sp. FACHB-36 TaxID=2692808 RepID=UPI0016817BCD|nr:peptidoglycan DD-metalloendopeptidase family protein [Leptolyngbya sp. FACHB-36]MBD2022462.1 peptidoglycan DD-metalloendopeptidase family protein [Leptolyngbya sp. FACHB-36]